MGNFDRINIGGTPLTDQEKFVLEQVEKGEVADLQKKFGDTDENHRFLRACFVEALLTGEIEVNVKRQGILIGNAVIFEPINLQLANVNHAIIFNSCMFKQTVDFGHAYFLSHFALSGSTFFAEAKFRQMKVNGNCLCRETKFYGAVDFARIQVGEDLDAKGASFYDQKNMAIFNGIKVNQNANFNGVLFQCPVDFTLAKIGGNFSLDVWHNDGTLQEARFKSSASFAGATVGCQFQAWLSTFEGTENVEGEESNINFSGMLVGDNFFLDGASFKGVVDFSRIQVGGNFSIFFAEKNGIKQVTSFRNHVIFAGSKINRQFQADEVHFLDEKKGVNFNGMMVDQNAFFDNAVFMGPVSFSGASIGGQFVANEVRFDNKSEKVIFIDLVVGDSAIFDNSLFRGPVDFGGVVINKHFLANKAKFNSEVNFSFMKVGHIVFLDGVIFSDRVVFGYTNFMDLLLRGDEKEPLKIDKLIMPHATVRRKLEIINVQIATMTCINLKVKERAIFSGMNITENVDLRDSRFRALELLDVTWPKNKENVLLEGIAYESINSGDKPEDWKKLLQWIDGSRFSIQPYSQLESYFQRCGNKERADEVFIKGKRQEISQRKWFHPGRWGTNLIWGLLAGYGRKPGRTFLWSLAFIFVGALVFDPIYLEPGHWMAQIDHPYLSRLILSLDRFLPGVDLGIAKIWKPVNICIFSWIYWHFQKLLGWVLIPIALAAIYTRIK